MVTALARLGGRPVGFIANQPLRLGGMINADACDKGAHFIALCDAYRPADRLVHRRAGLLDRLRAPSAPASAGAAPSWSSNGATPRVPRVSIVVRKGYGLGYFAMCGGRSFAADACFAWPSAEICAMSIEGAIDVAFRKEYLRRARSDEAPPGDDRRDPHQDRRAARRRGLRHRRHHRPARHPPPPGRDLRQHPAAPAAWTIRRSTARSRRSEAREARHSQKRKTAAPCGAAVSVRRKMRGQSSL